MTTDNEWNLIYSYTRQQAIEDGVGLTTENSPTPSAEKSPTWLPVFARRERISAE